MARSRPGPASALQASFSAAPPQAQLASTRTWQPQGAQQAVPDTANVSGAHRFKYFKRPVIPFLNAVPPEIVFDQSRAQQEPARAQEAEPRAKEMATQSDYRESEQQTDPFTPDYVVKPGTEPEVLTLASLAFAAGLPAGLREVQLIERARQKRAFEASMPPLTDESSMELRRRMMSEQELREWALREQEVKEAHGVQVERFAAQLRQAADQVSRNWEDRVEHLRQIKLTEKDKALAVIQRRRIKVLRQLSDARRALDAEEGGRRRDIVRDYSDFSSSIYAPVTREGKLTQDKLSYQYEIDPALLGGLHKVVALEASLPKSATHAKVRRPPKDPARVTAEDRKAQKVRDALERVDASLRAAKQSKPSEKEQKEALLAAYRVVKPLERPPTPRTEGPDQAVENAAVLLQSLLRGRAAQNMMFEGKERRLELIRELRAEEAPALDAVAEVAAREGEEREAAVTALCGGVQAELVSHTLDFLAKELVRFREERALAEMVRQAEWVRRRREVRACKRGRLREPRPAPPGLAVREPHPSARTPPRPPARVVRPSRAQAEESGRRQLEQLQRDKEDAEWREAMRVYRASADTYLAGVIADAVDAVAARQAAYEAKFKAEKLDLAVSRVHEKHDEAKMVVLDIVSSFLFPEVRLRAAAPQPFARAPTQRPLTRRAILHPTLRLARHIPGGSPAQASRGSRGRAALCQRGRLGGGRRADQCGEVCRPLASRPALNAETGG